jgi:phosphoribosyl 1,2-cyclic phosphate phosphodiesterase
MEALFLGTGTSVGIPVIGCDCPVCRSGDPRNTRRRTSLYLQAAGQHIVVDTPPDFREQVLTFGVPRVDAVLYTHSHADHIFGLDDIRRFNTIQHGVIPAYANADTLAVLLQVYDYAVNTRKIPGLYRPMIAFRETAGPFMVGDVQVEPVVVEHGPTQTQGYRFEAEGRTLGFVPDCHALSDAAIERFHGVDVMVLDALRRRPHPTHFTVEESVAALRRIDAGQSYLVHLCHDLDHADTEACLPDRVRVSYDGLALDW